MLHRVALVRTDVLEERSASFIKMTRICELGTTWAALRSSETLILTWATRRNFPEDSILQPPGKPKILHNLGGI
jgi:hypothetical protein